MLNLIFIIEAPSLGVESSATDLCQYKICVKDLDNAREDNLRHSVGHPEPQVELVHPPRERTYGCPESRQYPLVRQTEPFPQQCEVSSSVQGYTPAALS